MFLEKLKPRRGVKWLTQDHRLKPFQLPVETTLWVLTLLSNTLSSRKAPLCTVSQSLLVSWSLVWLTYLQLTQKNSLGGCVGHSQEEEAFKSSWLSWELLHFGSLYVVDIVLAALSGLVFSFVSCFESQCLCSLLWCLVPDTVLESALQGMTSPILIRFVGIIWVCFSVLIPDFLPPLLLSVHS